MITYKIENDLSAAEFKEVLINSTLGERRPINDQEGLKKMVKHANLIATARYHGKLVGVSRAMTDFSFCTYLSDLAVDLDFQKRGIGKELIRLTKLAAPEAKLILLAAPNAISYYQKIGMSQFEHCYLLDDIDHLEPVQNDNLVQQQ
ncbi:MAG: GNAT family N-acetyltransferase [Reichenbachiella sp.]|uniref:GNAT family N-acetyltransferase n=1 Tax=Reichenbachiella sp. TaxID=2184521 RepID=UPI0032647DD0